MEEVIDSSHHNLWEGQTLPFPFWVTRVIILKFFERAHTRAISVPQRWRGTAQSDPQRVTVAAVHLCNCSHAHSY